MALVRSRRQNADAAATRFDFTHLELLITVAIVALLAGMVLPALNRARDQAREITCAGSLKQLSAAHAQYAQASDDFTVPPAVKWEWWKYWPGNPLFRSLLGLESAFYQSREEYEASYPVKPFRFSRLSSIRRRHLAGRVPRAKRLGRSERSEIPVQEICTWREIQEIRVFLLDRTRIFGYIVSVIFKFIVIR